MDLMDKPKSIQYSEWWRPGTGMMYRRDCLPPDHPEQTYNYVKRTFNVNPEDYGIPHPLIEKYKDLSREELVDIIESMQGGMYDR